MSTTTPEATFTYELLDRTSGDIPDTCLLNEPRKHLHVVYELAVQSSASLILSVFGSVLTGFMLNFVQKFPIFQNYPSLFILIPILLNLIGCLEMNLTSRLSTLANMDLLNTHDARRTIISKQLILLQVQTITVGTISGLVAFLFSYIHESYNKPQNISLLQHQTHNQFLKLFILISTSVATGCISSVVLGALVSLLVIFSLQFNVNPDNILTPIVSSFGDLISISTFSILSTIFVSLFRLYSLVIFIILVIAIFFFIITRLNETQLNQIALSTWIPLFISLLITSGSGILFENYVYRYHAIAFMLPICQGLNGNIGCIYASRISTALQMKNTKYKEIKWTIIITLFCINLLFQTAFLLTIYKMKILFLTLTFIIIYQLISGCVVIASLLLGEILMHLCWKYNFDPDIHAFPILSSVQPYLNFFLLIQSKLLDFIATFSLVFCFRLSMS
ncbi:hypothetical protein PMAC_001563 [Pneumocystis sp. 'macacae']|nr:hypothetical protein PMAC_001563 [Pneumocystis sp. 'macacae']